MINISDAISRSSLWSCRYRPEPDRGTYEARCRLMSNMTRSRRSAERNCAPQVWAGGPRTVRVGSLPRRRLGQSVPTLSHATDTHDVVPRRASVTVASRAVLVAATDGCGGDFAPVFAEGIEPFRIAPEDLTAGDEPPPQR